MARPKSLKCPSCGAHLKLDLARPLARCEYCGANVERAASDKPARPGSAPAPRPTPNLWLPVAAVVGVLFAGGLATFLSLRQDMDALGGAPVAPAHSEALPSPNAAPVPRERFGFAGWRQSILVDGDADGRREIVGWVRLYDDDAMPMRLAAFDAESGARLWMTPGLVDDTNAHAMTVTIAGERLLIADPGGQLRALSPADGRELWRVPLGERVKALCRLEDTSRVEIVLADERVLHVLLASGQLEPQGTLPKRHNCLPLWSDEPGLTDTVLLHGDNFWGGPRPPRIAGLEVEKVLRDLVGGHAFALGYREPGTRVPTVAAFEPDVEPFSAKRHKQKKVEPLWLTAIPQGNVLEAYAEAPRTAGYAAGRLFVPYRMADSSAGDRLAAFDAESGANLWDIRVPDSDGSRIAAIVATAERVHVSYRNRLHVFDATSGAHLFRIGE